MRKSLPISILAALALLTALEMRGATASSAKSSDSDDSAEATPKPKRKHHDTPPKDADAPATPKPKAKAKATPKPDDSDEKPPAPAADSSPSEPKVKSYYPSATVPTSEIVGFSDQPARVQHLIEAALDLAKLNLTYTYGSADPSSGGMDCSGAVYYLLRQQGLSDVPRDASEQYVWARKHGQYFAVLSRKAGGFEFSDLLPGDLLFWNGTYSIQRDPPVTHSMIYLGVQRHRGQPIMWGSSDGRSFDGKQRWGVSVFDFTMPRTDTAGNALSSAVFLGYARIPGLRNDAPALSRSP